MRIAASLSIACLFAAALPCSAFAADKEEGWVNLFNGKNLEGWTQKNGTATYRVEGDTIVGKTNEGSPNSFLATNKDYGNFELTFEVKVDDALNSGVQIRSASIKERDNGRVHGPQVEISTDGMAGFIYGEATPFGWLSSDESRKNEAANKAFKKGEWNKYRVLCEGTSIKTWVNDVPVADLKEEKTKQASGFIALQVHGIAKGAGPFEVRWRNIKVREIK